MRRPGARLGSLDLAIARRRVRHERVEQLMRRSRDLIDRAVECGLVRLGGPA